MSHPELLIFFFLIAIIYASVGFGGGSSYIAILAMYALPYTEVRLIALVCNIIVVTGGTILFIRNKQVDWEKTIPLLCAGFLMAFLGAMIRLSENIFYIILAISLIIAGILLCFEKQHDDQAPVRKPIIVRDALLGGGIGFLSGMVGIGGGIFLSPLLNFMNWDTSKKIAATASIFILVNSASGIAAQLSTGELIVNYKQLGLLALAVFVGGQLGSRIAIFKFDHLMIKRFTGVLVLVAGIEVLIKHLS